MANPGKSGRKPTPTKILELRGSWRAKKRRDPPVEHGLPDCPTYLDEIQEQLWRRLTTALHAAGLLAKLDGDILGRYCVLYTMWRKALDFVRQYGETYPIKSTEGAVTSVQCFPQVYMISKYHNDLLKIEAQFGMTPSARASLGMQLAERESVVPDVSGPSNKPKQPKSKARLFSVG